MAGAARFGNVLDYTGPNLTSSQLVVYAPCTDCAPHGPNGNGNAPQVSLAQARAMTDKIAAALGTTSVTTLETTSANLSHAAAGRSWSGPIYVATPQLLRAFGISASAVGPDADILTMRPGLSTMSLMQLTYGNYSGASYGNGPNGSSSSRWPCPAGSCLANPPSQEVSQLPSGTSAPNTVITEHAIAALRLRSSVSTTGWLIQLPTA